MHAAPLEDVQRKEPKMSASGIAPTSPTHSTTPAHTATSPANPGGGSNTGVSPTAATQASSTAPGTGLKVNKRV